MEWQISNASETESVIVPDEWIDAVLALSRQTGVPIDAYSDQILHRESTGVIAESLRHARNEQIAVVEKQIKQELRVRELPDWSQSMLQTRLAQNELINLFSLLIDLCEKALKHGSNVAILGQ